MGGRTWGWGQLCGGAQLKPETKSHVLNPKSCCIATSRHPVSPQHGKHDKGKATFTELSSPGKGLGADLFCSLYILKVCKKRDQKDPPSPAMLGETLSPAKSIAKVLSLSAEADFHPEILLNFNLRASPSDSQSTAVHWSQVRKFLEENHPLGCSMNVIHLLHPSALKATEGFFLPYYGNGCNASAFHH